jgi:hypothetical protein
VEFGHVHAFERIPVGGNRRVVFSPHGEGAFVVEVEFESVRTLASKENGYVTSGLDFDLQVSVRNEDIWSGVRN